MNAARHAGRWLRHLTRAARVAGFLVLGNALVPAAHAGCLHTNQLWSCIDAAGNTIQLYCVGTGAVLTCFDFAGGFIQVAPHEVLSQIGGSSDSQVSAALAAEESRKASLAEQGGSTSGGSSHGASSSSR
jgi:hypothetical protein